jgi:hypothetical protein
MSTSDDIDRVEIDTSDQSRGRLRRAWDTLQDTVRQPVETVTRSTTLQTASGDVEDIDPPEDIDEFVELYYEVSPIRKNVNEFVSDVTAPGIRVQSPDDATEAYFHGGDDAPDAAPEGGFLSECFVFDERRQPFGKGLELSVRDRWVRGTVLVEYLKDDPEDEDSIITGFKFIRPETVSARTYDNRTQLVKPDDTDAADMTTKRDEAAAYVQFDEESILGRRTGRDLFTDDDTSIPLSQNDVLKLVLDQDIGGDNPEAGVFGESIIRACKDDADAYRNIKTDLRKAIRGKAWGIWTLQMTPEVLDLGDSYEVIEWNQDNVDSAEREVDDLGPGDALMTEANIDLERHDGDVPDLEWALKRYARDIIDPLPAPFYKHSNATDINQFVTKDQQEDYQELIRDARGYQAAQWETAFREVARRHDDLQADGLTVTIEPDEDASPITSLDEGTIDKIATFAEALDTLSGQLPATDVFGEATIRELVAMLPENAEVRETLADHGHKDDGDSEQAEQVAEQFDRLLQTNGHDE